MVASHEIKMGFGDAFHVKVRRGYRIDLRFDPRWFQTRTQGFFLHDPNWYRVKELRAILDGWRSGRIWFVRISEDEVARLDKVVDAAKQPKPPRSDKGTSRFRRSVTDRALRLGRNIFFLTPREVPEYADADNIEMDTARAIPRLGIDEDMIEDFEA